MDLKGYTFEQTADYAYEKYLENGNLLIIMNTKNAARQVFGLIKSRIDDIAENAVIIHLSTSMCPQHRKDKLELARTLLDEGKPVICVTTQLIEAGVDISFNCVIRSAAGLENAAQAAGRCNRHGRDETRPVYVINVKDEKLGTLKQIKEGQNIFMQIAEQYSGDMFGNEAVKIYFRKLYNNFRGELDYPCEKNGVTLLDMLSLNRCRRTPQNEKKLQYCGQAFATAGKYFKVIDEDQRDIIVPYNAEAEEIIFALNSDISGDEEVKLLRRAQKYTVGVYSDVFRTMLENRQIYGLKCEGVYALDRSFFSGDLGIDAENAVSGVIIY